MNKLIQLNKQKYNNSLVNFLLPTVMFYNDYQVIGIKVYTKLSDKIKFLNFRENKKI